MACPQTITGLAKDCDANIGGIKEVYIANFDDVTGKTVTTDVISAITMASSAKFKKFAFPRNTGVMTSTYTVDQAASVKFVTTTLALQFNHLSTAKRLEMNALALADLAVIVLDSNGKYWYLGYDDPVTMSAGDQTTGTARTDANRYAITLEDVSRNYPYEVSADAIATIID